MDKETLKKHVEVVMRQTECYNVDIIQEKLKENNYDVVNTVCAIMNIEDNRRKEEETQFSRMRKILEEKDVIYHNKPSTANLSDLVNTCHKTHTSVDT
jgi:hypothetical protein